MSSLQITLPHLTPLSEPLQLSGSIRLPNRFVATAQGSGAVADNLPADGDAEYWARVAAGGAAMVIVGGTVTAENSTIRRGNFTAAWRPEVVPGLRARADAIHAAGATAVLQLVHLGRETLRAETYWAPVGPSAVRSPREPVAPRALSEDEIDAIVESFHVSAVHAFKAGFDGIELHAAHGYLLAQLLSPVANRRQDAATAAGRAAPVWRVVDAVRAAGPDRLLGIRFSVGDAQDTGLTVEQLGELLVELPAAIDYVNLTVGMRAAYVRDMATERPPLLDELPRLRPLTDRPLVACQSFRDPAAMEQALAAGADMVGMARALIADPELPRKVLSGRARTVRPCVACNEDCRAFEPVLLCSVNPDLAPPGQRWRPAAPVVLGPSAAVPRRVAVIGAGPAGLECALALSEACEVVLWERAHAIGGALAVAGAAPQRHGWLTLLNFYRDGLEAAGVELRLGREPQPRDVEDYDAIVIATGAEETLPSAAGAERFIRTSSAAIAAGPEALAGVGHVVVVDDGFGWWPSVSAVELGVAAGVERITLVTPGAAFASGIPAESRTQLLPRLRASRFDMRPLTSLAGAGDGTVDLIDAPTGRVERLAADAVIAVGERRPRDWSALVPDGASVQVVGDAVVPRRAAHAIAEGRAAARALAAGRALVAGTAARAS
jgi:2,4-dienoyl-CoA reductase-like NADH-dependent reductase (Old Yellow Enzyme family)